MKSKSVSKHLMLTYIFVQSVILFGKFMTVITKRNGIIIFIGALVASTKYFELVPSISGEKSICASPGGDPAEILKMLDFCSPHGIEPIIEEFPLSHVKEAKAPLKSGKARYRGRRYKGSKVLRIKFKVNRPGKNLLVAQQDFQKDMPVKVHVGVLQANVILYQNGLDVYVVTRC